MPKLTRRELLTGAVALGVASAPWLQAGCREEIPMSEQSPPPAPAPVREAPFVIRPAGERGRARIGWLDARYSFSFSRYQDPDHMGFRSLRVLNEDRIAAGGGFPMHPHRDMEILTYVLEGALEHRDTLGNGGIIRPGEVQYMCAGTGIRHSEFNPSAEESTHLLQIWLFPDRAGHQPGYDQRTFPAAEGAGLLRPVASPDGRDGSISIHQDAVVYQSLLRAGETLTYENPAGRYVWLQVARGRLEIHATAVEAGDGVAVSEEGKLVIKAHTEAELLLFDLA